MTRTTAPTRAAPVRDAIRNFRRLWLGQSVSMIGDQVALFALPTVAILTLHADDMQVGVLRAAATIAYPLLGLPAGAILERRRKRPAMIAADLVRCAAFLSIPLAAWRGALTMTQLLVVAVLAGVFTIVFDIASQTYLPLLLPADRLATGNSRMEASRSVARLAGAPLGGGISQLLGAVAALGANGLTFVCSVTGVLLIRTPEPPPAVTDTDGVPRRIAAGVRMVWHSALLRPLTLAAALRNFGMTIVETVLPLVLYHTMRLSVGQAGAVLAAGSAAAVLGALLCPRLMARYGIGAILVLTGVEGAVWLLVPAAAVLPGPAVMVLLLAISSLWLPIWNAAVLTLRQTVVPRELLGRVHATARTINLSAIPLGAVTAGVLADGTGAAFGEQAGLFLTVMLGGTVSALSGIIVLYSRVRRLGSRPADWH